MATETSKMELKKEQMRKREKCNTGVMRISKRKRKQNGKDEIFEIIFGENLTTWQKK